MWYRTSSQQESIGESGRVSTVARIVGDTSRRPYSAGHIGCSLLFKPLSTVSPCLLFLFHHRVQNATRVCKLWVIVRRPEGELDLL